MRSHLIGRPLKVENKNTRYLIFRIAYFIT